MHSLAHACTHKPHRKLILLFPATEQPSTNSATTSTNSATTTATGGPPWQTAYQEYADFTLTNGQFVPHWTLPRGGARRLRVLNAAASMTYELTLDCAASGSCELDACSVYLMALDGMECVLLLQNVISYYRMHSLTIECVLLL